MQRGKKNRKDHRQPANFGSVTAADHVGMQPQQDTSGHFHDLMECSCTNHDYPVKHLYKDCQLLKHLLRQTNRPKKEKGKEATTVKGGMAGKDPND